jgi:hypothetical protein
MRRNYDVFEKFPDGSTLWRACVGGRFEAQRKVYELSEQSENKFFMIAIQADLPLRPHLASGSRLVAKAAANG